MGERATERQNRLLSRAALACLLATLPNQWRAWSQAKWVLANVNGTNAFFSFCSVFPGGTLFKREFLLPPTPAPLRISSNLHLNILISVFRVCFRWIKSGALFMQTFWNSGSRKEFTNPTLKTARFSNSLDSKRFRTVSEQRTRKARVKDRAEKEKKRKKGPLSLSFHFSRGQNRKSRSSVSLCSETNRNTCYAGYFSKGPVTFVCICWKANFKIKNC